MFGVSRDHGGYVEELGVESLSLRSEVYPAIASVNSQWPKCMDDVSERTATERLVN